MHTTPRTIRFLTAALLAVLLCTAAGLRSTAAQAPPLPHAFFGAVEAGGQPAPVGAQVEARADGVRVDVPGNPIYVMRAGGYGGRGMLEAKLLVQGEIAADAAIEFYVNDVRAECAEPGGAWQASYPYRSGQVTELNLRIGQGTAGGEVPTPTPTATPTATATWPPENLPPTATPTPRPPTATPEPPPPAQQPWPIQQAPDASEQPPATPQQGQPGVGSGEPAAQQDGAVAQPAEAGGQQGAAAPSNDAGLSQPLAQVLAPVAATETPAPAAATIMPIATPEPTPTPTRTPRPGPPVLARVQPVTPVSAAPPVAAERQAALGALERLTRAWLALVIALAIAAAALFVVRQTHRTA